MFNTPNTSKPGRIGTILLVAATVLLASLAAFAGPVAAAGDVTVNVQEQDGDSVGSVDVVLYDAADDTEVDNGTTGSGGSVTFASVADGDYYAVISGSGILEAESSTMNVSGAAASSTVTVDEEIRNETVSIDNSTQTLWAELEATNESDMTAVFYGINSSSDAGDVELSNETVTVAADSTEILDYSLTDSDLAEYDSARIVIGGSSDDVNATDYGTTVQVSGGGGSAGSGLPGGAVFGIPILVILVVGVGGAFLLTRD